MKIFLLLMVKHNDMCFCFEKSYLCRKNRNHTEMHRENTEVHRVFSVIESSQRKNSAFSKKSQKIALCFLCVALCNNKF